MSLPDMTRMCDLNGLEDCTYMVIKREVQRLGLGIDQMLMDYKAFERHHYFGYVFRELVGYDIALDYLGF